MENYSKIGCKDLQHVDLDPPPPARYCGPLCCVEVGDAPAARQGALLPRCPPSPPLRLHAADFRKRKQEFWSVSQNFGQVWQFGWRDSTRGATWRWVPGPDTVRIIIPFLIPLKGIKSPRSPCCQPAAANRTNKFNDPSCWKYH